MHIQQYLPLSTAWPLAVCAVLPSVVSPQGRGTTPPLCAPGPRKCSTGLFANDIISSLSYAEEPSMNQCLLSLVSSLKTLWISLACGLWLACLRTSRDSDQFHEVPSSEGCRGENKAAWLERSLPPQGCLCEGSSVETNAALSSTSAMTWQNK